jgi:Tfp pilus assembly protein PilF
LGRVLIAQKQFSQAEVELKNALESNPNDVESHYALARLYQQLGRREDSRIEFELCAKLNAQRQKMQSGIAGQHP